MHGVHKMIKGSLYSPNGACAVRNHSATGLCMFPLVCCLPLFATWLLCSIVCDQHDRLYPANGASAALNHCATDPCMFPTGVLLVTFSNKDDRSESS